MIRERKERLRHADDLVPEHERDCTLRSKGFIVNGAWRLLDRDDLDTARFQINEKDGGIFYRFPRNHIFRTKGRLRDVFPFPAEAIQRLRRIPREIELRDSCRVRRTEQGADVLGAPDIVEDEDGFAAAGLFFHFAMLSQACPYWFRDRAADILSAMFNPFPSLLALGLFGPFMLRIAAGAVILLFAFRVWKSMRRHPKAGEASRTSVFHWYLLAVEACIGISLIFGFLTQIGAIIGIYLIGHLLYLKRKQNRAASESRLVYGLLLIIMLSLLVSGAGAFAFDLPL